MKYRNFINVDNLSTYGELAKDIITEEEKEKDFKELIKKILDKKRMILVIDELDRCNPTFACQILENIKHFYDLQNITIIVVANNKELSNTIKKQYGDNFNSYGYLNKFYDIIIILDNLKNIEYAQKVLKFSSTTYLPHNIAFEMFKKYNFSYRECNRYKVIYEIEKEHIEKDKNAIFDRKEYTVAFDIVLPIIISFKIKDIDAYQECLYGSTNSLKNELNYIKDSFNNNFTHKYWLKELAGKEDDDEIETILNIYTKFRKEGMYKELFNNCIRMSL